MGISYGILKPERGKIDVCLRKHSAKQLTLSKQTVWERSQQPTLFHLCWWPKPIGHWMGEKESTGEKRKTESQTKLLDKIDLTGLGEWSQNEQKQTQDLITEYTGIVAMSNMNLGKTCLVKHSIRLTDNTLFKECYQQIPMSIHEKVRVHLKEMLEIGAIWPPYSTWASPVILNAHTIKDSYSLPRIEDTIDSLNGAVWFTALDVTSGLLVGQGGWGI